jgi:putative phosphoserine phosphatase/1-acylglycerol-3-phosphate O-acyltransferase
MTSAAIFDLDRTLIARSSGQVYQRHLGHDGSAAKGVTDVFYRFFDLVGESALVMQFARFAPRAVAGRSTSSVLHAAEAAADEIFEAVPGFAKRLIAQHRDEGRLVAMATTTPTALAGPLAARLGFDSIIATEWESKDGFYTGKVAGEMVWAKGKLNAVRRWAKVSGVDLTESYAYSDSIFDTPLLSAVGHPVAVNPDPRLAAYATARRWPIRFLDVPEGVMKVAGREAQDLMRPFLQPDLVPNARFDLRDLGKIPLDGPAIIVANHRSYFDAATMVLTLARSGRSARFLGKKELFDIPVVGQALRIVGGIEVDRGSGSDEPLDVAIDALHSGEAIVLFPQGTIPRGEAFFEPVLQGRWGAARLAEATRAPVIPIGIWGSDVVWPRSAKTPKLGLFDPAPVSVSVGDPVDLKYRSLDADTTRIMSAIADLLPPEAHVAHTPTDEELARTFPPNHKADEA